jgi:hypothetical protein
MRCSQVTPAQAYAGMVTRLDSALTADPARVLARLFVPGHEFVANTEFCTGVLGSGHELSLDDPGPHVEAGRPGPAVHDRALFAA